MNIIFIGFKRCGKTYYGLKAAQSLHMNFIDSDLLIEKLYTKIYHTTLTYREIVKKHGFTFFRSLESQVVPSLMKEENSIISLGGGMVLDPENVERLSQVGKMIFLKTPKKELIRRIFSHDPPLYLNPENPLSSFEEMYQERLPIYEKIASYVIDTDQKTEEQVLEEILSLIVKLKEKEGL